MPITVKYAPSATTLAAQAAGAYERERSERDLRANQQIAMENARLQQQAALAEMAERSQNQRHQSSLQLQAAQQQALNAYRQGSLALQGQAQQQRAYESERDFGYRTALSRAQLEQSAYALKQKDESLLDNRIKAAGEAVRTGRAVYTNAQKNKLMSLRLITQGEDDSNYSPKQNQQIRERAFAMERQIMASPVWRTPDERPMSMQERFHKETYLDRETGTTYGLDDDGQIRSLNRGASAHDKREALLGAYAKLSEARAYGANPQLVAGMERTINGMEEAAGEPQTDWSVSAQPIPEGEGFGLRAEGEAAQGGPGEPPPVMNAQQSLDAANENARGNNVPQAISVSNEEIMSGNLRPGTVYRSVDKKGVERFFVISQLEAGHGPHVFVRLNPETGMWEEIPSTPTALDGLQRPSPNPNRYMNVRLQ